MKHMEKITAQFLEHVQNEDIAKAYEALHELSSELAVYALSVAYNKL